MFAYRSSDINPNSWSEFLQKIQNDVAMHQDVLNKLESKTQDNKEKIGLIGVLFNENTLVIRNAHDKDHLIFFNRDWTIDRMPQHLKLNDEDKE